MAQEAVLHAGQGWRAPACPAHPPALAVIAREMTLRRGGAVQIWLASVIGITYRVPFRRPARVGATRARGEVCRFGVVVKGNVQLAW
jgi:hypothetical protein